MTTNDQDNPKPSAWDRVVALLGGPDERSARSWWWDGGDLAAARIQERSGGEWWVVRVSACCGRESATVQGNYVATEDKARELVAELLLLAHETARRAAELARDGAP